MISADDILAAARRYRLDVPAALADEAAGMMAGTPAPVVTPPLRADYAPVPQPADTASRIDRMPLGSGPLARMTIAVKDNIAVAGAPVSLGSGQPGFLPRQDAAVAARLHASGAVLTVKAQCEAFLLGANSFTSRPLPVPNPGDPRRSAGGSSSGSASLVARGACDAALGTDSGGSLRIPAAYCGVVGFKPTRGIVPYTGIAPLEPFLETAGPMARSASEVERVFAVIAGADGLDCRAGWGTAPESPPQSRTRPPRLCVLAPAFGMLAAPVRDVFERALLAIRDGGAILESAETDIIERGGDLHLAIYMIGQAATLLNDQRAGPLATSLPEGWHAWWHGLDRAQLPRELSLLLALGAAWAEADPSAYGRARTGAGRLALDVDTLLSGHDALLLPTVADIAPLMPAGVPAMDAVFGDTRLTAPFNLTGHPAISLPAGTLSGLPLGLQLVGRRGGDLALLELAQEVERWLAVVPPEATAAPTVESEFP